MKRWSNDLCWTCDVRKVQTNSSSMIGLELLIFQAKILCYVEQQTNGASSGWHAREGATGYEFRRTRHRRRFGHPWWKVKDKCEQKYSPTVQLQDMEKNLRVLHQEIGHLKIFWKTAAKISKQQHLVDRNLRSGLQISGVLSSNFLKGAYGSSIFSTHYRGFNTTGTRFLKNEINQLLSYWSECAFPTPCFVCYASIHDTIFSEQKKCNLNFLFVLFICRNYEFASHIRVSDTINLNALGWIKWWKASTNRRASVNSYSDWEKLVSQANGDEKME